ncbi:hypothetical protein SAMN02910369_00721 [Lachnospiraceae bacterium NE2001]|nr:hypothetical protein SAMN02910369_00721 [Lachnospiraceae bacterium NE2001]
MGILQNLTEEEKKKLGVGTRSAFRDEAAVFSNKLDELIKEKKGEFEKTSPNKVVLPQFNSTMAAFHAYLMTKADPPMSMEEAFRVNSNTPGVENLQTQFADFIIENSFKVNANKAVVNSNGAIPSMFGEAEKIINNYKLPDVDYTTKEGYSQIATEMVGMEYLDAEINNQISEAIVRDAPYVYNLKEVKQPFHESDKLFDFNFFYSFETKAKKDDKIAVKREIADRYLNRYKLYNTVRDNFEDIENKDAFITLSKRHQFNALRGKNINEAGAKVTDLEQKALDIKVIVADKRDISENRILDRLMGEPDKELDELAKNAGDAKSTLMSISLKANLIRNNHESNIIKKAKQEKKNQQKKGTSDFKLMSEIVGNTLGHEVNDLVNNLGLIFMQNDADFLNNIKDGINDMEGAIRLANDKRDIRAGGVDGEIIKDVYPTMNYTHFKADGDGKYNFESNDICKMMSDANTKILENVANMKATLENMNPAYKRIIDMQPERKAKFDKLIQVLDNAEKMAQADEHFLERVKNQNYDDKTLGEFKNEYTKSYPEAGAKAKDLDDKIKTWKDNNKDKEFDVAALDTLMKSMPEPKLQAPEVPEPEVQEGPKQEEPKQEEPKQEEPRQEGAPNDNKEEEQKAPEIINVVPPQMALNANPVQPGPEVKNNVQPEVNNAEQPKPEVNNAEQPKPEVNNAEQPQPEAKNVEQPQPERKAPVNNEIAPTHGLRLASTPKLYINKKDTVIRGDKRIEAIQKATKKQPDGPTYDQFIEVLAIRQVTNSERGSKKKLKTNVYDYQIENTASQLKDNYLLKSFYDYCKADKNYWKIFKNCLTSGHGGLLEDNLKNFSNALPFNKIPTDDLTQRYLPKVNDRIEFWQKVVKNDIYTDYKAVAAEILVCRNVGEAKKDDKSSLDKRITGDMIKKGGTQEKNIFKNDNYNLFMNQFSDKKLKEMIANGHGGELAENMRQLSDRREFNADKGLKEVMWCNTVKGAVAETTGKIKRIEKKATELLKSMDGAEAAENKAILQKELNKFFPELVAEAVVLSEMNKEARNTKGQIGLRQDFDTKDFRRRVAKKMDDNNFTKTYQEFIKPNGRPAEFTIEGIAAKFEAAAQKVNAPKRQNVKSKNTQVENQNKLGV